MLNDPGVLGYRSGFQAEAWRGPPPMGHLGLSQFGELSVSKRICLSLVDVGVLP
jgi:hypothetical protein